MEIARALQLRKQCYFYLRSESVLTGLPRDVLSVFQEDNDQSKKKLEALRSSLSNNSKNLPTVYSPSFSKLDTDGKVILTNLDEFGANVLQNVWSTIEHQFPVETTLMDPLANERSYHDQFIETRVKTFVGRRDVTNELIHLIEDSSLKKPIMLSGRPGDGKSALLGYLAKQQRLRDTWVLPHFIGGSPQSISK